MGLSGYYLRPQLKNLTCSRSHPQIEPEKQNKKQKKTQMQLFRLRGLGPSRCTRQPRGTGPKHQERNLANDSAWHPNPRTPQTVKLIREQIFKRLTPAQHRLRHLRGHRLAKAPAAPVLLTRALPRGLAPHGFSVNICRFVYIFFFFF